MGAPAVSPRTRPPARPKPRPKAAPKPKPKRPPAAPAAARDPRDPRVSPAATSRCFPSTRSAASPIPGSSSGCRADGPGSSILGLLLGGIVALNVVGLSLSAAGSETSAKIDELQKENSVYRARIANRLSNERVTKAATALGLAFPPPTPSTTWGPRGPTPNRPRSGSPRA